MTRSSSGVESSSLQPATPGLPSTDEGALARSCHPGDDGYRRVSTHPLPLPGGCRLRATPPTITGRREGESASTKRVRQKSWRVPPKPPADHRRRRKQRRWGSKKIKRNQNERTPQRTCHTAAAWVCRMPRPHPEGRVHFRCQGSAAATGGGEAKEAHRIDPAGVHRHCQGGGRSRGPRLPQPTSGRYSPRVGRRRGLPAARAAPTHCLPAGQTPADLASPW